MIYRSCDVVWDLDEMPGACGTNHNFECTAETELYVRYDFIV